LLLLLQLWNTSIKLAQAWDFDTKATVQQKLTLRMGLLAHDLVAQLPAHLLRCSKSLVPVVEHHPQRLNLPAGALRASSLSRTVPNNITTSLSKVLTWADDISI
jgi:hypothetical protein